MDTGSPASDSSEKSELVVYEPSVISPISDPLPNAPASIYLDSDPRPQELTAHVPGDNATHHTHGAPAQQPLRFDPRALLNPSSSNPKRPASSGNDTDRGRADPTIAGQVSLVERLHNVHERPASPAKRPKLEDTNPPKTQSASSRGGGALDLATQGTNSQAAPMSGTIDLTNSESLARPGYS